MVKSGTNNLINSFHFQTLTVTDVYWIWSGPEKEKTIVLTCTPAACLFWLDWPTLSENDTDFSWTLLIKYDIKLKIKWNIPDLKCTENATDCSIHNL